MLHYDSENTVECRYNAIQYNIIFEYGTAMTEAKYASEVIFTKDTLYLALTDELWGVFCWDFGENWPRYNGTALQLSFVPPRQLLILVHALYLTRY